MQPLSASVFRRGQKREFGALLPAAAAESVARRAQQGDGDEEAGDGDEEVVTLQELQEVLTRPRAG